MWTRVSARGPWRLLAPRRGPVRAAHRQTGLRTAMPITCCFAAVTIAACGTAVTGDADIAVLADRADRLAEHLDAGEGCSAEREGNDLVARARDGVAADRLDQAVADEIIAVVDEVTSQVPCEDEVVTEEDREAAEEEAEDVGEEAPAEEDAEDPREEAPAEESEGRGNGGNGGNGGDGPPGRSEEGPPGQRGNSGRGR